MRRHCSSIRGSAAVEAAVLLPLLILLMLGIIDLGRFSYAMISVATAARNGAVYGSKSAVNAIDKTGIAEAVRLEMVSVPGYSSSNPAIKSSRKTNANDDDSDVDAADGQTDYSVKVKVSFDFNTLIPYPALPSTMTIARKVHMRVEP